MLRTLQLNLMAESVEIFDNRMNRNDVNLYFVKNTRENCD